MIKFFFCWPYHPLKNTYKISGYDTEKTPILANFMNGIEIDMDKLAELDIKNPIK